MQRIYKRGVLESRFALAFIIAASLATTFSVVLVVLGMSAARFIGRRLRRRSIWKAVQALCSEGWRWKDRGPACAEHFHTSCLRVDFMSLKQCYLPLVPLLNRREKRHYK
jgi:hypothetical protein